MTDKDMRGLTRFIEQQGWQARQDAVFNEHFGQFLDAAGIGFETLADLLGREFADAIQAWAFEDFVTRDYDDGNIIDLYLAKGAWKETASTKAWLAGLRASRPGLYHVAGMSLQRGMMFRDLIRGGDMVMIDEDRGGLGLGVAVFARVVALPGQNHLSFGCLALPEASEADVVAALGDALGQRKKAPWPKLTDEVLRRAAPVFGQAWLAAALTALHGVMEGMTPWEVVFPLKARVTQKAVAARLDTVGQLFRDGKTTWLWSRSGEAPTFEASDGLVELEGRELFLETVGEAWAREGAALLAEALGDLVGAPDIRDEDDIPLEDEGDGPASAAQAALDAAQMVIYEAWEARTSAQRVKLARKALDISHLCADAYNILAGEEQDPDARLDWYAMGVKAGQAALGAEFDSFVGVFWGVLETRPYMRARGGLAMALLELGREDEAIGHLRELLRLCPDDNPGNRDVLCDVLLARGDDKGLKALFKAYPDDYSVRLYSRALVAFRGKGKDAAKLARAAFDYNTFVPGLLARPLVALPDGPYITVGGEDEAAAYVFRNRAAWAETPDAIAWLRDAVSAGHVDA